MKWRQSQTQHIAPDAIVHHSLVRDTSESFIHFKDATARRHDHNGISCSIKITIKKVILHDIQRDVDCLQDVALTCI